MAGARPLSRATWVARAGAEPALLARLLRALSPLAATRRVAPGIKDKHDLAALAAHNGPWRRRLVWLERDAPTMLRTLRGVSKFTQNVQFVQVVWDPLDACVGQWPLAQRSNRSVAAACAGLRLDTLVPLHQRTKRDPKRAMTIALRELASAGTAEAALRRLVDFLALPDAGLDLEASAAKIVARLSPEVRDAPPEWARAAVAQNSTLRSWLSGLRQALELKGAR